MICLTDGVRGVPDQASALSVYRVGKLCADGEFATVTQALAQWASDRLRGGPLRARIEIGDSCTYHEAPRFCLGPGEALALCALDGARPLLRMFDYRDGSTEQIIFSGGEGSSLLFDGITVAGGPVQVAGSANCTLALHHCVLVPGWDTDAGPVPAPARLARPSLVLLNPACRVDLCDSVIGAIEHGSLQAPRDGQDAGVSHIPSPLKLPRVPPSNRAADPPHAPPPPTAGSARR